MKTVILREIGNSKGVIFDQTVLELLDANKEGTSFQLVIDPKTRTVSLRVLDDAEKRALIKQTAKRVSAKQSKVLKRLASIGKE